MSTGKLALALTTNYQCFRSVSVLCPCLHVYVIFGIKKMSPLAYPQM